MSCNFKTVQFLFKSHYAELLVADRCVHFAFLTKDSPRVIYSVEL